VDLVCDDRLSYATGCFREGVLKAWACPAPQCLNPYHNTVLDKVLEGTYTPLAIPTFPQQILKAIFLRSYGPLSGFSSDISAGGPRSQ